MEERHLINEDKIDLNDVGYVINEQLYLEISDESKEKIRACRAYLDNKVKNTKEPLYGINTGFGSLYKSNIDKDNLEKLQVNLVMSHACGTGPEIPDEIVRLMLFTKIQSLSYGYSGVQIETVQRLVDLFNEKAYPVVYEMGSLGASGDLVPLAHLVLPLLGLGLVNQKDKTISGEEYLASKKVDPIHLKAKKDLPCSMVLSS